MARTPKMTRSERLVYKAARERLRYWRKSGWEYTRAYQKFAALLDDIKGGTKKISETIGEVKEGLRSQGVNKAVRENREIESLTNELVEKYGVSPDKTPQGGDVWGAEKSRAQILDNLRAVKAAQQTQYEDYDSLISQMGEGDYI